VISSSLKKSRGDYKRPWSCSLYSMAAKFGPIEKISFSDFGVYTAVVPVLCVALAFLKLYAKASLPKPLSPFGCLEPQQLRPLPSLPLGWPRRTHTHEPGAAAGTKQLSGALTAEWVPRDQFWPHAQESVETHRPPTDFVTWSTIAHDMPRWRLLAHSTSTPSPSTPNPPTPSPPTPNQPPANPNAPLPGYGNLAPCLRSPDLVPAPRQAQYAETRAAGRAARYASRANRAGTPPQQHHLFARHRSRQLKKKMLNSFQLSLVVSYSNADASSTRLPMLRRQDLL
jgi:hypothetical protein